MKLLINENSITEARTSLDNTIRPLYDELLSKMSESEKDGRNSPMYKNILDWAESNNSNSDVRLSNEEQQAIEDYLNGEDDEE